MLLSARALRQENNAGAYAFSCRGQTQTIYCRLKDITIRSLKSNNNDNEIFLPFYNKNGRITPNLYRLLEGHLTPASFLPNPIKFLPLPQFHFPLRLSIPCRPLGAPAFPLPLLAQRGRVARGLATRGPAACSPTMHCPA